MSLKPVKGRRKAKGRLASAASALLLACALPGAPAVEAGVKFGDAVPGVIRGADLARIRRALDLDRFSVVAAVRIGAEEGREAVLAEALDDATLARIEEACGRGGFCPDRSGFVASRVRVVLLLGDEVATLLLADREIRAARGRVVDLREVVAKGRVVGWSGRPEAASGHVALALTPIVQGADGRVRSGTEAPLRIRWNDAAARFQIYACDDDAVGGDAEGDGAEGDGAESDGGEDGANGEPGCRFEEEPGG